MTGFDPPTWNGEPIPHDAPIADLRAAIEKSGPKAWAAIRALAVRPSAEALNVLIELSRSSDAHLRRAAIEAIGVHPSGATAHDVILKALHDHESVVIRTAIEAGANHRLASAHDRILALVTDSEESTRVDALRALGLPWQAADFQAVFDRYLHDPSDRVRKQAAWTLHENLDAENWKGAFSIWSKDALPRHREWACELALRFGDGAVVSVLEELWADADGHVRAAAERALAQILAG